MKSKYALMTPTIVLALLFGPAALAQSSDSSPRSDWNDRPKAFVKDSAITAKIKTKLAAEHLSSLSNIKVDTDNDGVVWLHGTAQTEEEADQAAKIARNTEGVTSIRNDISVKQE
jgi:hyperosmotically inducible periplasmic protein